MNSIIRRLRSNWQQSTIYYVYNVRDAQGRGRLCLMLSGLLGNIVAQLTNGLFLTSFLLQYNMDKSQIGILIFVPYIASLLNIFSPALLERFARRRGILIAMKILYYVINILGVTLLPSVVSDSGMRIAGFVALILAANIINQLASSGWTAWQAAFLPDRVRVDFFQLTTCIQSAFVWVAALAISFLGDMVSGTEHELVLLTVVRYASFALAIVECLIWLIPKEFPYAKSTRIQFSNIFTLPIKNRRFLLSVLLLASYNFVLQLPSATINAYLLQDCGIRYSLINGINALYFVFFIFLSSACKTFVTRHYWYRSMGMMMIIEAISYAFYIFVTAHTAWIYVIVRLIQHILGVFMVSITNPLLYDILPKEDQTNYLSFYTIVINGAIFLSMMLGTALAAIMGNNTISILGYPLTSTQLCLAGCAVGEALVCVMAFRLGDIFKPKETTAQTV